MVNCHYCGNKNYKIVTGLDYSQITTLSEEQTKHSNKGIKQLQKIAIRIYLFKAIC